MILRERTEAVSKYEYQRGTTWVSNATDPLSHTWRQTWDNNGNVISATDPLTRTATFAYNATNDLTLMTNTIGLTTTFAYDSRGNLLSVARPVTETNQMITTTLAYDPAKPGDVLTVTNPLGKSWRYAYDSFGYVMSTTNPLTETARFTHDALGRLKTITSPRNYTTTLAYNNQGLLGTVTDAKNYTTTYQYYPNRALRWLTDANNRTTSFYYDLDTEPISVTVPGGIISRYEYDNAGRVISQSNNLGQITRHAFDDVNRVVTMTDPLTQTTRTTRYAYDLAGRTVVMTNANSLTTTYAYDAADQLTGVTYQNNGAPPVSYAYNNLGLRTVMTDGTGTTTYAYDSLNRLKKVDESAPSPGLGATVIYTYDIASRITAMQYPAFGSGVKAITREYDDANRMTSVSDWLTTTNHTIRFGYDLDGDLTVITYPNYVNSSISYDQVGQVVSMNHRSHADTIGSYTYAHDPVGLITSTDEGDLGTHNYTYDPYRLTGEDLSGVETPISSTWQYDAATQITKGTRWPSGDLKTTTNRKYDAAGELTEWSELVGLNITKHYTHTYSLTGNRTQTRETYTGQTTNYTYDQANRLTGYNGIGEYHYNGDGLRMNKSVNGADPLDAFGWDIVGGLPLLLFDSHYEYIYGPGGMVLEQVTSANEVSYLHGDQLGSIRLVTDAGGSIANSYEYDAYGARTETGPGTVASAFGYTGEYTDEESGLVYLRARYYDPATQQFLTVDPIVGMTGQAYNYVGGSPLNGRDPSGLDENCSAWPNPFDEYSCIREGLQHPLGPWVVVGGVIAATGGIACVAGGCEAIGAALGIGGVAAESQAPAIANELSELAPATENAVVSGVECDVQSLQFSQTVAKHLQDLTNKGTLARPYMNSRMLIQEIINSGPPSPDPQGALNRWYWRVPGFIGRDVSVMDQTVGNRVREGWWELLINPDTNTIEHYLFKNR